MKRVLMTIARYLHPRGAVSFWHTKIGPIRYDYSTLDDYYIDLRAKTNYAGPFDAAGIPLLDYFGAIGKQYNPCAIAQWGLGGFQRWKRGEVEHADPFWKAADWLRENLDVDSAGRGFWWYRFDFDAYGLRAPWPSALAQAQGISLLLRASRAAGDESYLLAARQACAAMLSPVSEGGLLLADSQYTMLEEVVADRPTAILDGMVFAVFGLQDYCLVVADDAEAKLVLDDCMRSIAELLPRYDLGYWSRADLYSEIPPMPASRFYHGLHVAQLEVLADLTGNSVFAEYAQRWATVARSSVNRLRAFFNKLVFKFRHY
ncbi:MAG: D-glucuronyl C5-epimerase family protein [Candidatus Accumulibacter meliphilus]|jgi:heparosan-N-sulfate-glucuronate 5-epimerase|uniref:D-glucuronyl C5-epimerase family protein n=1 Tax=Candidatus Accumulibacter meliphilus TaxID=2211374 RepID=UPI002FC2EABB